MALSDFNKIKKTINEFFSKTGLPVNVEVGSDEPIIQVSVKTDDPQLLIGERGQTLMEIQCLIRLMLRKQLAVQDRFFVDVDVNDYKKRKNDYLKEMARMAADEVALTKKEKELMPMLAYERRLIHLELASRGDVITESVGEGMGRRVIIKSA